MCIDRFAIYTAHRTLYISTVAVIVSVKVAFPKEQSRRMPSQSICESDYEFCDASTDKGGARGLCCV